MDKNYETDNYEIKNFCKIYEERLNEYYCPLTDEIKYEDIYYALRESTSVEKDVLIANMYLVGDFLPKDVTKGEASLEKAKKYGSVKALYYLSRDYKGHNYYKEFMDRVTVLNHKDHEHKYLMGMCYMMGKGIKSDKVKGELLLIESANDGNRIARFELANRYHYGEGVDKSITEAVDYYKLCAEQGNAIARYRLGNFYSEGMDVIGSKDDAFYYFEKAANQGHSQAQYSLANCYHYGHGTERNFEEAIKWYQYAASNGTIRANYHLGKIYHFSDYDKKDIMKALVFYKKGAEKKDKDSILELAKLYLTGSAGAPKRIDEAAFYFERITDELDHYYPLELGTLYFEGEQVRRDLNTAKFWFEVAVDKGSKEALEYIKKIDEMV